MYLFQLSGMAKSENIRYFCGLLYELVGIPVCFLNRDNDFTFEFGDDQPANPLYPDKQAYLRQLAQNHGIDCVPVFTTTRCMEIFFTIAVVKDKERTGTIIVGPAVPARLDMEAVNSLFSDSEIPLKKKYELTAYYQSLPATDYGKLISASILLHYLIYGEKLDSATVIEKNSHLERINEKIQNAIDTGLMNNRRDSIHHYAPSYEKFILKYVKEGNKEKLLEHINKPARGESGKLSKNPLRNQKNLFICSTALITRAAIEGGLDPELSLTISDSYIQRVEEMNDINEIMNLHHNMLLDFTDRVHHIKQHNYSKAVNQCISYIFNHLYDEISISLLSERTGLTGNYLSELFKKEVGVTINEYILREKIEEAKRLLVLSDSSIMDISTCLNFCDQSYFTKTFKKYTGMTPKQFRSRNP